MKKIIVISCIIVVLIFFNYPVFESKGISYLIIFACFVAICFSGAKIYFPSDKEDYDSVEKEADQLEKYDGDFQYTNAGFYNKQKTPLELIKWDEIISVYSFSIPISKHRRETGLEIITEKGCYELGGDTPGIEKLSNELYNHLPDWQLNTPTIRINNYGLQKTKLYERNDERIKI
ncbi:hypothetical protein N6B72_20825 [Chryseobacterium soli]|uniref:Uncharacterized protein n=1 Tax=Chryseobacterium soli TaxID=445961 RepID=A0A086A7R8_9FLAO|nr:hypothetical protein [Chryseobacterium soli]KFF12732.1 hypothetical protein IW15_08010 [Chryseobacterium soli]MDV7699370.1 hypothetical protein [Chryseobacterium soli]